MKKETARPSKSTIQVGDALYLWKSSSFLNREEKRELEEVEVIKVNTVSVYIKRGKMEERFDKKKMTKSDGFGGYYELFIDPAEFYVRWDTKQELIRLRKEIQQFTQSASMETLKQVHAIYSQKERK